MSPHFQLFSNNLKQKSISEGGVQEKQWCEGTEASSGFNVFTMNVLAQHAGVRIGNDLV